MWNKLEDKYLKVTAIGVILLSLISSGIFAYYNHSSQQEVKENQEEQVVYDLDKLLDEARSLYYQGEYDESIEKYKQILEYKDNKIARENLASVYETLGEYSLVIKEYEAILEKEDYVDIRLDLAIAYYNLDKINEAKIELEKILNSQSEDKFILRDTNYYLSLISFKEENYQQAEDYIRSALGYNNFALGYYQLGKINFVQGKYSIAIDNYKKALTTDGSLKGVNRMIALSYLNLGEDRNAVIYLKQANKENSSDQAIQENLDRLKEEHPEYFDDKDLTLPEERKREIPKVVTFKEIKPIESPGRELRIGIIEDEEEVYFRVGSDFIIKEGEKIILEGKKSELVKAIIRDGKYYLIAGEKEIVFSDSIQVRPKEYAPVLVHNIIYGRGYYWGGIEDRQYRGALELIPQEKGITVVNLVHMEEYLMAVIPSEMSALWPIEALKTQAVAARSYTLANLGKHSKDGYDLCSDVHCAAYRGINREHPNSNQAVLETAGEVMTYNGKAVNAVYSANSGGYTENSEDVWTFEIGYLRAVSTEKEDSQFPLNPAELKDWLRKSPDSYSKALQYTKESHYRWQRNLSVEYLENSLGIKGIKKIVPTYRGKAGSVKSLLVVGTEEEKEITYSLRSKFGGLRSNRFWIQPQYQDGKLVSFLFYGGGWGHSVGMDQVAVAAMADDNYQYIDILNHFYTDTTIEDRY
jgi:SpoIID/LytB domain protein